MTEKFSFHDPILDSIADGVFTVDKDWKITVFNKAAERITGISREEAKGQKCWEVFHADICERDCLLKKTLKSGRPHINETVNVVNRFGSTIPISISTAILKDSSGRVIGGVETFRDLSEIEELRKEVLGKFSSSDIITRDHRILDIFNMLPAISQSGSPVLILGESGTGKELLARAIHNQSGRKKEPFIAVNCGALPENLLESELFGYKKGAFTDAKSDKPGRFHRAGKGTLFLDEIGDLPKSVQVKLLRVLQEKTFEPLGAVEPLKTEARIIGATNRNLEQMVKSGEFRQDLYYRINVIPLMLPPLRDRKVDIPLLVDHFLYHFNQIHGKSIRSLSTEALRILFEHCFPGNIRELENIMQHAFILCQDDVIKEKHFPAYLTQTKESIQGVEELKTIEEFEKRMIEETLLRNRYNRVQTAKEMGVHTATLWRKMKKYGI